MKTKVFKSRTREILQNILLPVLVLIVISAVVIAGLRQTEASSRAEGRRLLEESIQNAVVRHYAIEGCYPASVEYIEERYGVFIDRSRYAVYYTIFAPNIMPEVTVVELK